MTNFAYDVFVSYRQVEPDLSWVRERLVPRLQVDGLRVCVDYLSFRLGAPLVHEMERAVETSRYTLAVLTPGYLASTFTDLEVVLARHLGLELRQRRLVAVRLDRAAEPPLHVAAHLWWEIDDTTGFETVAARLAIELRRDPGD